MAPTLASTCLLAACSTPRPYTLDRSSGSYSEMLQARAECRRAGGKVVEPAGESADLKGYRCVFPREPKVRVCRQWTMYASEADGLHELGFRCLDER